MFLLLLILLVLHLSSSRHMEESTGFPQAFEEFKDRKVSRFQIVSHTSIPGGPNPLHN